MPRAASDVQTLFSPILPEAWGVQGYGAPGGGEALSQGGPFPVSPPHSREQESRVPPQLWAFPLSPHVFQSSCGAPGPSLSQDSEVWGPSQVTRGLGLNSVQEKRRSGPTATPSTEPGLERQARCPSTLWPVGSTSAPWLRTTTSLFLRHRRSPFPQPLLLPKVTFLQRSPSQPGLSIT